MYEKYLQMLQLVYEMQSSEQGVTYRQIQDKLQVSRRTAERMVKAIGDSFLEIELTTRRPKRWRLKRIIPTPNLTLEQISILKAASRMFEENSMPAYAKQTENLIRMLRANMDSAAREMVAQDSEILYESEGFVARPGPREYVDPELIRELRHAILACQTVSIKYTSSNESEPRLRTVEPYGFLHGVRQYLVAFNPDSGGFRTYTMAKIRSLEVHERQFFERRGDFSFQDFLGTSFGVFQEKPYNVVWRFDADISRVAQEWNFHRSQKTRRMRDGRLEVSFRAGGINEMASHLITWGDKVEVVKPKRLIERLREIRDSIRVPD
ncbi:MAG: WYL domain-containing protein [Acidiferrobacterales bacterium]|nr:WYL domain-containing protein [Acidiferrobacterales bacterium]